MVLAVGKVLFQHQEVAAVFAETREIAMDAAELVEVDYEPLDPVSSPFDAMKDEVILRDDRENKTNHIYHWESGNKGGTEAALAEADVIINEKVYSPRCHPAPLEPCGCLAQFDAMGRLNF